MNNLFFLDALCDTRVSGERLPPLRRLANELTPLMLWMGGSGDRVLSRVELLDEYRSSIETTFPDLPDIDSSFDELHGYAAAPWGWSEETRAIYSLHGIDAVGPDPAVVASVGSRAFCARFNRETNTGVPGTCFCMTVEEVLDCIESSAVVSYVVKPEYSSSGAGFVHCVGGRIGEIQLSSIQDLLKDGCGVVVEPWCDRTADLSTVAHVNRDGSVISMFHQRNFTTRLGVYYGNLIDDEDEIVARYRNRAEDAVRKAAVSIAAAGYYGPVGFDHIIYLDGDGNECLAAVVDINPRLTMANLARSAGKKISPDTPVFFRFTAKRKLSLPDTLEGLKRKLGDLWFDPVKGCGIVPLSSPRIRHPGETQWIQPFRSAWAVVAKTQEEIFEMDERLRNV